MRRKAPMREMAPMGRKAPMLSNGERAPMTIAHHPLLSPHPVSQDSCSLMPWLLFVMRWGEQGQRPRENTRAPARLFQEGVETAAVACILLPWVRAQTPLHLQ